MKEVSLSDTNYFVLSIGKRILKKHVFKSKGTIRAFSSNVFKPFGLVSTTNIDDFDHEYVLWGIDGNFEFSIKYKGEEFATTDHCGTIKILNPRIMPEYLVNELRIKKYELGFDRGLRSSLSNMQEIVVGIPCDDSGQFDPEQQRNLSIKYEKIAEDIGPIKTQCKKLDDALLTLNIDTTMTMKQVQVLVLFRIKRGLSKYTHRYIRKHAGPYPVYSSQTDNDGVMGSIDTFDLNTDCLTWTTDGALAGTVFLRKGQRFSMTDHSAALILKDEYQNSIDLEYAFYLLRAKLRAYAVGEGKKRVKVNIAKKVELDIPVDDKGIFDLAAQKAIVNRYRLAYETKSEIVQSLAELCKIVVTV